MAEPNPTTVPNHHGDHRGFSGLSGLGAAISMLFGRGGMARLAAQAASVTGSDVVVDIGCGPGVAARAAARRGATVTGVDPAGVMLEVARVVTWRRPRPAWVQGTAEALPIPDGSATVAWSLVAVHHWVELDRGLAEVRRVLAPGGRLVAIERRAEPGATGHASHGWTESQADRFLEHCQAAGLTTPTPVERHHLGRQDVLVAQATKPAELRER